MLAKFLAKIVAPLIGNNSHHVRNSHEFATECLVSFDVVSLFTNVPIPLAMLAVMTRLRTDNLEDRTLLSCEDIEEGLRLCLNATCFAFQGAFYQQVFGTAMGSPISVVIANVVMETIEEEALATFMHPPRYWKRYVDDTFGIIAAEQFHPFLDHLNGIEESIQFTLERENEGRIAFLDVEVSRDKEGGMKTNVYRKPTHTNRYLSFWSAHPIEHKKAVVRSLKHRAEALVSDPLRLQDEMNFIKDGLRYNSYPPWMVKWKPTQKPKEITPTIATVILPYVPGLSDTLKRMLTDHGIKVYPKPHTTLRSLLSHPVENQATEPKGVVYLIPCGDCEGVYIGETGRALKTRLKEHRRDVAAKDASKTALSKHSAVCNHRVAFENVRILERETDLTKRLFLETLHIHKHRECVNNKEQCTYFPTVYNNLI
ncbi:uncharacterized protein LOC144743198 isoform X2 [Ciona intestinalis]